MLIDKRDAKASGADMESVVTYPPVTRDLLKEIVRRILEVGTPEKVLLFGSHARGDARSDSDLDLFIVEKSPLPRYKRAVPYRLALLGAFPAKDIVVYTPKEIEDWRDVPNSFVSAVLREGKVLYERRENAGARMAE